jgi:hypothetical protein
VADPHPAAISALEKIRTPERLKRRYIGIFFLTLKIVSAPECGGELCGFNKNCEASTNVEEAFFGLRQYQF